MATFRSSPLFLIAEIESVDGSSDAGAVYNPSSFRHPSSLLIHPKASFLQNVFIAFTYLLRYVQFSLLKYQKGIRKDEWLCQLLPFNIRCKFQKAHLAHARYTSKERIKRNLRLFHVFPTK